MMGKKSGAHGREKVLSFNLRGLLELRFRKWCSRARQSPAFCACSAAVRVLGSAPGRDPPLTETITEEQSLAKQAAL